MIIQQTINSAVKEFDEKFKPDSHEFLEVRGVERDTYVLFMGEKIKSHLTSSIKKAVEEAYKAIGEDIQEHDLDDKVSKYHWMKVGRNEVLSLIEKKKSEFLNKNI